MKSVPGSVLRFFLVTTAATVFTLATVVAVGPAQPLQANGMNLFASIFLPWVTNSTEPPPSPWTDPSSNIEVIAPVADVIYHSPLDVTGFSRTFEGNVNIRLLDQAGNPIAERAAIGGSVEGFDFFHTYLRFTTTEQQDATLEVFETSPEDGSRLTEVLIPLTIRPGQRFIDLDTPAVGASVCSPVLLSGYSNTFEANVVVDLRQRDGTLLAEDNTMGGNLGFYREFIASLSHSVDSPQPVLASAYDTDASTGRIVDLARVPVSLYPADTPQCP